MNACVHFGFITTAIKRARALTQRPPTFRQSVKICALERNIFTHQNITGARFFLQQLATRVYLFQLNHKRVRAFNINTTNVWVLWSRSQQVCDNCAYERAWRSSIHNTPAANGPDTCSRGNTQVHDTVSRMHRSPATLGWTSKCAQRHIIHMGALAGARLRPYRGKQVSLNTRSCVHNKSVCDFRERVVFRSCSIRIWPWIVLIRQDKRLKHDIQMDNACWAVLLKKPDQFCNWILLYLKHCVCPNMNNSNIPPFELAE